VFFVTGLAGHVFAWLVVLFSLRLFSTLLLAYLVVAIMPNAVARVSEQVARNPFVSGLVGAGTLVATPIVFILLLVTCIGILLVPLALFVCMFLGKVAVAQKIGNKIRTAIRGDSYHPYVDVTIGILLLGCISFVPVMGGLAKLILIMAGLGAVVLTRFGSRDGIGLTAVAEPVASIAPAGHDQQPE